MEHCAVMSEHKADLVDACQQGDREAFRQLFETYKDKIYSIALYFFSGDPASAKDVTQQVFLKLITKMGQFRNEADFATWLYRLVSNTCLDEQRRRKRLVLVADPSEVNPASDDRSQEQTYMQTEVESSVKAAVSELKPKLRMAILLKYFEELSYDEMATVLGCSKGTVASRLHRGHKILARKLSHWRRVLFSGE